MRHPKFLNIIPLSTRHKSTANRAWAELSGERLACKSSTHNYEHGNNNEPCEITEPQHYVDHVALKPIQEIMSECRDLIDRSNLIHLSISCHTIRVERKLRLGTLLIIWSMIQAIMRMYRLHLLVLTE